MSKLWWIVLAAIVASLGGIAIGLVLVKKIETGKWEMLGGDDLVRVRDRIASSGAPRPSRVIYLARGPLTLKPGDDDAPTGTSSVVAAQGARTVRVPGWKGTDRAWGQVVGCVRELFAPFEVEITDRAPDGDDYLLVAVGGRPKDIGVRDQRVGGLAPFSGAVIPRAVVFAFAAQLGNRPQAVCETIGMEVAHAYGLDHAYLCKDVMTYLPACGKRRFVDQAVACGEGKRRACAGGAPTQNSFRRLLAVLGPRADGKRASR